MLSEEEKEQVTLEDVTKSSADAAIPGPYAFTLYKETPYPLSEGKLSVIITAKP